MLIYEYTTKIDLSKYNTSTLQPIALSVWVKIIALVSLLASEVIISNKYNTILSKKPSHIDSYIGYLSH